MVELFHIELLRVHDLQLQFHELQRDELDVDNQLQPHRMSHRR